MRPFIFQILLVALMGCWMPWHAALGQDSVSVNEPAIVTDTSDQAEARIYQFEIRDEIGPPAWRLTQRAVEEAHARDADGIILVMNTYGGLVDAADSIRTKLLHARIPVYVVIENNAASAGALIALACDSIYMKPGSTIGAATVVNQSGEQVPDKYQSYMRKKMRATAEQNGRNPDIAEAMVDPDVEVPGVSEKGKVVTFTTTEALEHGFCDAEVNGVPEALAHAGITRYVIEEHEPTGTESAIGFLIQPWLSGLLIMVIIGGIYFELQTPGVGFPLVAAIIAALVYFAPLYLEGLAENWEILIFVIGLVLLALEIFVIPGFGVAGIAGITLIVTSLALSMVGNVGFDFSWVDGRALTTAFLTVLVSSLLSVTGSIALASRLLKTHALSRFVLQAAQKKEEGFVGTDPAEHRLVGKQGTAVTVLRPSGLVEVDGDTYDATADIGFIDKGTRVEVVNYETAQLFVRPLDA